MLQDDDSTISSWMTLYSFPTLEQLEHVTEQDLRDMGWGYRAKYVMQTKELLQTFGGLEYLMRLREETSHDKVQDELIQFVGIGRKVADCISLFSLDQTNAIPVDVHVWNMARRDFGPTISNQLCQAKSLTPTLYKMVGDLFRARYPTHAGWAHSLLFVAELPSFRPMLPPDMVIEMDEVRSLLAISQTCFPTDRFLTYLCNLSVCNIVITS
jgi:N-glycosylase/DNA lyase